jgi:hypothetical protein
LRSIKRISGDKASFPLASIFSFCDTLMGLSPLLLHGAAQSPSDAFSRGLTILASLMT